MLRIEHLTKKYGDKKAVDDLSLHIQKGEIYGFIGHNGAGKTTTIKSCCGILNFDEGEIYVDGVSVKEKPLECKRKIAYIPDNPDLYEFMTGIKYLNFIADIFGISQSDRQARIIKYAEMFEIKKADLKDLENKKEDIGSVTFVDKVKNIQPTKKQPTRKGVYEDHYILRYVKYAIVIIIVIAIIIVLGYSFVFMKSNDSSFKNSNTSKTETSETLKKKTTETDKKKTTKSDTTKKDEQTSTEITFTKNADGDYSFKLPDGYDQETFKLKVDFTFATTVDLHVNGDPNSYQTDTFKKGVYSSNLANISASDALKDDSACESVELEFNVNDFQYLEFSYSWNLGHRYYINDQKIPLEENDHYGTSSNGRVRTFKLTMVK